MTLDKDATRRRLEYKEAAVRAEVRNLANQISRLTPGTPKYLSKIDELTKARHELVEASKRLKAYNNGMHLHQDP